MGEVYGWEALFAIFFVTLLAGGLLMLGMALFVGFLGLLVLGGLLALPFVIVPAIRGVRQGWRDSKRS